MEDIGPAGLIEHIGPSEEAGKRLAIPAVADETEAGVRRDIVCDAAHMAASATKPEMDLVLVHPTQLLDPSLTRTDALEYRCWAVEMKPFVKPRNQRILARSP
jgi:hypothetical protein